MSFQELQLNHQLLSAVEKLGFEVPTPVQEQVIPFLLTERRDLVALAQTGTGKTAAFGLPILQLIDQHKSCTQCLILSPTRELCVQIAKDLKNYSAYLPEINILAVYGGEDIRRQLKQLDNCTPHIIVATPGRLIDLLKREKVCLKHINYLVLDEADEMLDMGFKEDIDYVLSNVPSERRVMLFSATMPTEISNLIGTFMANPQWITIGQRNSGTENVDHIYYVCQAKDRYLVLKRIVDMNPNIYAIVFCRTKQETGEVAEKLMRDGYNADALHGDLNQAQRDAVMQKFRLKNLQILVATDVAARGLDVSNLTHVINYNLPDDKEVYTHRSGRTGRANKRGISIAIIHQREKHRIKDLERLLKRNFQRQMIPNGLDVCRKQLFNLIDKMQNVNIQDEQIDDYLPQVYKMLDYLSKEDIIKHFVSLEFNRFLEYYKDSQDLNVYDDKTKKSGKAKNSSKRKEKEIRQQNNSTYHSGKRAVLKINIGKKDGMTPKHLLGIINDLTGDRSISIGDIDITPRYTFFQVFQDQKNAILGSFDYVDGVRVEEVKNRNSDSKTSSKAQQSKPQKQSNDKPWRKKKR